MCNNAMGSFVYGGRTYRTVQMPDGKTWMAENLNYDVPGSVCYDNDPANCTKYGRLYTWHQAISAVPQGWHLPTQEEWDTLAKSVAGDISTAGIILKSQSGWNRKSNGTDNFGFSALPGGYGNSAFRNIGSNGYWWSYNDYSSGSAYFCYMNSSKAILYRGGTKSHFYSVRYVQN